MSSKKSIVKFLLYSDKKCKYIERECDYSECILINYDEPIDGFRIYDKYENGEIKYRTPWVYCGKKISIDEVNKLWENQPDKEILKHNIINSLKNNEDVILTTNKYIAFLNDGSITYYDYLLDYKERYESSKKIAENFENQSVVQEYMKKLNDISEVLENVRKK